MSKQNLTPLQKERIAQFKKTLKPGSKWYEQDLAEFTAAVRNEPAAKTKEIVSRIKRQNSKEYQKGIDKLINELDKGGMFNIKNMAPKNMLD